MPEAPRPDSVTHDKLPPVDMGEIERAMAEVRVLDPALLERDDTRALVELGARVGNEITERYGTPAAPRWVSGRYETEVMMSFHNGGEDGHTSVGPRGAGVPRNALLIAKAVNRAAGYEVYDPMMRAVAFYAAEQHDAHQLCGRALLPEGQGEGRGDERLSAEAARDRYFEVGGSQDMAQLVYDNVIATAFNPLTGTQNVNREAWYAHPHDRIIIRMILGQELTAAADLLGATGKRGPLGAIEYAIESLCLIHKGQIIQERLRAQGIEPRSVMSIEQLCVCVSRDEVLRSAFAEAVAGQAAFLSDYLSYSDEAIRMVCGKGIDELFPGRRENATILTKYSEDLIQGRESLVIWTDARRLAGYS